MRRIGQKLTITDRTAFERGDRQNFIKEYHGESGLFYSLKLLS